MLHRLSVCIARDKWQYVGMADVRASGRGGPELFRLVRFWSRRWAARIADRAENVHVQHVQVVESVSAAAGAWDADTSVVAVAHQLGVDRSVASRMIGAAAVAGYVRREGSPTDARRMVIRLTDRGRELLDSSHRWQQETFDRMVAHWDEAEQRRLADYLQRLAAEVIDEPSAGQPWHRTVEQ